jgi:hypothetical protein
MNKRLIELNSLELEDLEEDDFLLIWDTSENQTKRVSFQTLIDFIKMMEGNI